MPSFLNNRRSKLTALFAAVLLLAAIAYAIQQDTSTLRKIRKAPPFTLFDLQGHPVSFTDYSGKIRLVEFMFTSCPDICPITTYNMARMQDELKKTGAYGKEVEFITITFDPVKDTPEVLSAYADRLGIDRSGWLLLRGSEDETKKVTDAFNVQVIKQPDGLFVHGITSLFLIDANGYIRGIYKMGDDMDVKAILGAIEQLR